MRIAIFATTRWNSKELTQSFAAQYSCEIELYARSPENVKQWLVATACRINTPLLILASSVWVSISTPSLIVDAGNPARPELMRASIFNMTL
jgi:hypothetical protein